MRDRRIDHTETNEARISVAALTGLSSFALFYATSHLKEGGYPVRLRPRPILD